MLQLLMMQRVGASATAADTQRHTERTSSVRQVMMQGVQRQPWGGLVLHLIESTVMGESTQDSCPAPAGAARGETDAIHRPDGAVAAATNASNPPVSH